MATKETYKLLRVPRSRIAVLHAGAAIHHATIIENKPASLRTATLCGLNRIMDDSRLFQDLLIHIYRSHVWSAAETFAVGLKPDELGYVKECQLYLNLACTPNLDRNEVILLGIIRMARQEFGWHPKMTDLSV